MSENKGPKLGMFAQLSILALGGLALLAMCSGEPKVDLTLASNPAPTLASAPAQTIKASQPSPPEISNLPMVYFVIMCGVHYDDPSLNTCQELWHPYNSSEECQKDIDDKNDHYRKPWGQGWNGTYILSGDCSHNVHCPEYFCGPNAITDMHATVLAERKHLTTDPLALSLRTGIENEARRLVAAHAAQ
jgi:hypothetical protein